MKGLSNDLSVPEGSRAIKLYGTNFDVDFVNSEDLLKSTGPSKTYRSVDSGLFYFTLDMLGRQSVKLLDYFYIFQKEITV